MKSLSLTLILYKVKLYKIEMERMEDYIGLQYNNEFQTIRIINGLTSALTSAITQTPSMLSSKSITLSSAVSAFSTSYSD